MIERPQVLTRRRYLGPIEDQSDFRWQMLWRTFNDFGVIPARERDDGTLDDYLDPARVEVDRSKLDDACGPVIKVANRMVAHRTPIEEMPLTFMQLNDAIDSFEPIFVKYRAIVRGPYLDRLEPSIIGDWTKPFYIAWATPWQPEPVDKYAVLGSRTMAKEIPTGSTGGTSITDLAGLGQVGSQLIKAGYDLLMRYYGPLIDEKAQEKADPVRQRRNLNLLTTAGRAADILGDLPLHDIPDRFMIPWANGASNEDRPELQAKWATLLAQAATATNELVVLPSFPDVLKQLTSVHVAVLDYLYANYIAAPDINVSDDTTIQRVFNLSAEDYEFLASDLHRLQLIDGRRLVDNYLPDENKEDPTTRPNRFTSLCN